MKKILIFIMLSYSNCILAQEAPEVLIKDSVVHIGDSHTVGAFGRYMHAIYSDNFSEVNVYGVSGSSPHNWNSTSNSLICGSRKNGRKNLRTSINLRSEVCRSSSVSSLGQVLNKHRPEYVVFQFLGNSTFRSKTAVRRDLERSLNNLSRGQKCIFVTSPPYYKSLVAGNKKRYEYESLFRDVVKTRCEIISVMADPKVKMENNRSFFAGDRRHLSTKGARFFAGYVESKLAEKFNN